MSTAPTAENDRGPSVGAPEPHTPTAGDAEKIQGIPRQSTLADLTGEALPADAYIPEPTGTEAAARETLAGIMREYAAKHPGKCFDVYDAIMAASWDLPANCRGNSVMGPGVRLAADRGWIRRVRHDRKGTAPRSHAG